MNVNKAWHRIKTKQTVLIWRRIRTPRWMLNVNFSRLNEAKCKLVSLNPSYLDLGKQLILTGQNVTWNFLVIAWCYGSKVQFSTAHFCVRAIKRRITLTTGLNHKDKITNSQTKPTTYRNLIKVALASLRLSFALLGYFQLLCVGFQWFYG